MKVIISESQQKSLEELTTSGTWGKTDVDSKIFTQVISKIGKSKSIELIRDFFNNVLGKDISKIGDDDLFSYIDYGSTDGLPRYFKNADVISGLGYFLSKKAYRFKTGKHGLDFFKIISSFNTTYYYFFDSELELTIGYMATTKFNRGFRHRIYSIFPKGTEKVSLSMIDDKLIGLGYGKNMYLTVLDDVECLMSDDLLYKGSLNIWANVMPKYAKYAGYISSDKKIIKLPTTDKINYKDIDYFFASQKVNLFNKK